MWVHFRRKYVCVVEREGMGRERWRETGGEREESNIERERGM
jgi:hypothetical protein